MLVMLVMLVVSRLLDPEFETHTPLNVVMLVMLSFLNLKFENNSQSECSNVSNVDFSKS
jgi:hypothetical protein